MTARDYPSDTTLVAWPNCAVPDCEHKTSARRNSIYCDQHTNTMQGDNSAPAGHFAAFCRQQLQDLQEGN